MGVRVVLAIGFLAIAVGLGIDMSGRAIRMAGTDHVSAPVFAAAVPSNGTLCQPDLVLPAQVGSVEMLIGTYGDPVPSIATSFVATDGKQIWAGRMPAGAHEGNVTVPLRNPKMHEVAGTLCLRLGRTAHTVVFGGEQFAADESSEQIDGHPAAGRIELVYQRARPESWWQLLPALSERFGVGKTRFFGDWTLAAMVVLLAGVVIATLRLLDRELA